MKIVFMGTPRFAVETLEALLEAGHEVKAVVTQPDKPKGRGKSLSETPVKICAKKQDIPVFQPKKSGPQVCPPFLDCSSFQIKSQNENNNQVITPSMT